MQNLAWSNGIKAIRSSKEDNPAFKKVDNLATEITQPQQQQAQQHQAQQHQAQQHQAQQHQAQQQQQQQQAQQQPPSNYLPQFNQQIFLPNSIEPSELDRNFENDEILSYEQVKGDYSLTRNTYRKANNRRESSDAKLSERHMVSRACGNPFLTHLNYTDEIITQEQFLIPKNSNMENDYQQ